MPENNKEKLHAIIVEISKLSNDIDELKKKREELLDKFKELQSSEDEPAAIIKQR
jgi:predicted nuclease with TOPRIM domain